MKFINRLSTKSSARDALADLKKDLHGHFDLGVLFLSPQYREQVHAIIPDLQKDLHVENLIGCTAHGVIGNHQEVEQCAGISLFLAQLPDVKVVPFVMNQEQMNSLDTCEDWHHFFDTYPSEKPIFLTLPDPFMLNVHTFIDGLNRAYPDSSVFGGIASAALHPGENLLVLNDQLYDDGTVGFILSGNIHVDVIVSQGCRPIGNTYTITHAERNIVHTIANRPVLDLLESIIEQANPKDQDLANQALFLGIVMDEYQHHFHRGDFLIRGVMGADRESGAIAIADHVGIGQTVQFHVRDADTAAEDLNDLLSRYTKRYLRRPPKGALIFNCYGRGIRTFHEADHDIQMIQKHVGPIPAAGFFCTGEIGPVRQKNYIHGFTNSIALFNTVQETGV